MGEVLLKVAEENTVRMWDMSAASTNERLRLDVPRRGHVLTMIAEKYGEPIREAVGVLSGSLTRKNSGEIRESLLSPPRRQSISEIVRTDSEMVAWAITAIWVVGIATRSIHRTGGLRDSEEWFFGGDDSKRLTDLLSARAISQAEKTLLVGADSDAYYELLPYILDPHGPGSRLSVRRNPATQAARIRKRAEGVFYTPADIAEYMVSSCLDYMDDRNAPTVFDPACGTGVFLRAALKELKQRHRGERAASLASKCIFGVDIDPWPLDATAFVLLADIWIDKAEQQETPAVLWRRLRLNLKCIDTLHIDPAGTTPVGVEVAADTGERVSIFRLFPELKKEPEVIVGNPPYASLGNRSDIEVLGQVFKTLAVKPSVNAEIYLAFIEQMMRLASKEECVGALVLPLSIAYNLGAQFVEARRLIQKTAGHWRFAFFDREPHALFGEDVKTRNAILLWSRKRSETNAAFGSGPLQKWRGDSRAAMFKSIRFTEFDGDIQAGIPKIDGACQAAALHTLSARWSCLAQAVQRVERLNLAEVLSADDRMVFVGPTAYNFLNVFLCPPPIVLDERLTLSEHPLHAIKCASAEDALTVFGTLTSHFAYWWWHTYGDGFHVSRRFISEFPFGLDLLGGEGADRLCESGAALWSAIRNSPIISLNRGRTSLAYSPNGHGDMRRSADSVLADVAGLNDGFVDELQQFTAHTVAARLQNYSDSDTGEKGEG